MGAKKLYQALLSQILPSVLTPNWLVTKLEPLPFAPTTIGMHVPLMYRWGSLIVEGHETLGMRKLQPESNSGCTSPAKASSMTILRH